MTNEEIVAELKWTEKYIFDHTGYKVKYFRPPYGESFVFHASIFFCCYDFNSPRNSTEEQYKDTITPKPGLFKLDCILYSESSYQGLIKKYCERDRKIADRLLPPYLNSTLNWPF